MPDTGVCFWHLSLVGRDIALICQTFDSFFVIFVYPFHMKKSDV